MLELEENMKIIKSIKSKLEDNTDLINYLKELGYHHKSIKSKLEELGDSL